MRATTLSLLLVSAQHALAATDDHAGHDHSGATKHEWAGLFKVDTASHTWKMQKVGGKVRGAHPDQEPHAVQLVLLANPFLVLK